MHRKQEINNIGISSFLTSLKFFERNGMRTIAANDNLSAPISKGPNDTNDFLINIGELPQIKLKRISNNQA